MAALRAITAQWAWLALLATGAPRPMLAADVVALPSECGGVATSLWTSLSHPMPGYHVLCMDSSGTEVCSNTGAEDAKCREAAGKLSMTICWDGMRDCESRSLTRPGSLLELEEMLVLPLRNPRRYERIKKGRSKKQRWKGLVSFYKVPATDEPPVHVNSPEGLSGLVLAFEGGSFLWPGIEPGFKRNVTFKPSGESGEDLPLQLVTKHVEPLIIEVSSFLNDDECAHIIEKAKPHIAKSVVSHMDHDVGKPSGNWRDSSQYFMPSDDDILKRLDNRVSLLTQVGRTHQEYTQILRYEVGERYAAHHDYFDPNAYKTNEQIQGMTKKGLFNRMATVFFYLSDVAEGGHTNFPRAGGKAQPHNFENCDSGVSVQPQKGRVIIFYSQDSAGRLDEFSLHGGCAVKEGTKWSANKWIWNQPMNYIQ